ncbi:MAG: hypothetical protein M0P27_09485, partial [Bacteroidales bacterium]|nr:hypothetical protein [Bacteroidales bacterium]
DHYSYPNVMLRCNPDLIAEADQPSEFSNEESMVNGRRFVTQGEVSGFETLVGIKYLTNENLSSTFFKHLTDLRKRLNSSKSKVRSDITRSRIEYLMLSIDKGIGK